MMIKSLRIKSNHAPVYYKDGVLPFCFRVDLKNGQVLYEKQFLLLLDYMKSWYDEIQKKLDLLNDWNVVNESICIELFSLYQKDIFRGRWKCPQCMYSFDDEKKFLQHFMVHVKAEDKHPLWKSPYCPSKFEKNNKIFHLRKHQEGFFGSYEKPL